MAPIKLVLDTNIVLDCVLRREPFYQAARKLLVFGALGEYEMWVGSSQMSDLFYVLSDGGKKSRADECKSHCRALRKHVRVYPIGEAEVDASINSNWLDIEDSLVHQAAVRLGATAIITRNKKDFMLSGVPVFDADEFFEWLSDARGISYEEIDLVGKGSAAPAS